MKTIAEIYDFLDKNPALGSWSGMDIRSLRTHVGTLVLPTEVLKSFMRMPDAHLLLDPVVNEDMIKAGSFGGYAALYIVTDAYQPPNERRHEIPCALFIDRTCVAHWIANLVM